MMKYKYIMCNNFKSEYISDMAFSLRSRWIIQSNKTTLDKTVKTYMESQDRLTNE